MEEPMKTITPGFWFEGNAEEAAIEPAFRD
jgi:hypothetical protein